MRNRLNPKIRIAAAILIAVALGLPAGAMAQTTNQGQAASTQPQVPQPDSGGVNWKGVGIGAGTVASNLVYVPAKLVYGILGGIAGGAGYALTGGNKQVADTIWRSSLGGDYVLTPDMLKGEQPIYFSGPSTTSTPQQSSIAPIKPLPDTTASASPNASSSNTWNNANNNSPPPSWKSAPASNPTPAVHSGPTHPLDSGAGPANDSGPVPPLPSTTIE